MMMMSDHASCLLGEGGRGRLKGLMVYEVCLGVLRDVGSAIAVQGRLDCLEDIASLL